MRTGLRRAVAALLFVLLGVNLAALAIAASKMQRQARDVSIARFEQEWAVAAAVHEFSALYATALAQQRRVAAGQTADMAAVVTAYDVLYSRMQTLHSMFRSFGLVPDTVDRVEAMQVQYFDLVYLVDALSIRPGALEDLIAQLEAMRGEFFLVTLEAMQQIQMLRTQWRLDAGQSWQDEERRMRGLLFALAIAMLFAAGLFSISEIAAARARRALTVLRNSEARFPDPILVLDRAHRVLRVNEASRTLMDMRDRTARRKRALADVLAQRLKPSERDAFRVDLDHQLAKLSRGAVATLTLPDADGALHIYDARGLSTRDPESALPILILILRDVTELQRRTGALETSVTAAQASAALNTRLLSATSHELRTPINGILLAEEAITQNGAPPAMADHLRTIETCARQALDYVNRVLEHSRLTNRAAGDLRQMPLPLDRFTRTIARPFLAEAEAKGLSLDVSIDTGSGADKDAAGTWVGAAPMELAITLRCLISNALRYTFRGSVKISAHLTANAIGQHLTVAVSDTGRGIAQADLPRIFRPFDKLNEAEIALGAPGLGLASAQRAVELMGGTLEVQSTPGRGSMFFFRIPVRSVPPLVDLPALSVSAQGPVLVADDNAINRRLLMQMLERAGLEAVPASDGEEAVETAHDTAFSVILMDFSMPVMDGIQAAAEIRRAGASRGAAIIGVTARSEDEAWQGYVQGGMDDLLFKPLSQDTLHATLRAHGIALHPPKPPEPAQDVGAAHGADDPMAALRAEALQQARDAVQSLASAPLSLTAADLSHKAAGGASMVGLSALSAELIALENAIRAGNSAEAQATRTRVARIIGRG